MMQYELRSLIPFSFKEQTGDKPTTRQWIEQKFGIMPASKEFQRTDTQNAIVAEVTKSFGDEAKTKEDADRYAARREIRETLFRGQEPDQALWDKAQYSEKTKKEVLKDATLDPHKRMFRDLKSESQLSVWAKMSAKEKEDYMQYLNNKKSFQELHENKPEIFTPELEKAYQEILGDTHETRGRKSTGSSVAN